MDGTRIRLLALAAPLVVGLTLAVAALLAAAGAGDPGAPRVLRDTVSGPVRTVPTAASTVLVLPRTTPPPAPVVGAATGVAPAPAPEPAQTAVRPFDTP